MSKVQMFRSMYEYQVPCLGFLGSCLNRQQVVRHECMQTYWVTECRHPGLATLEAVSPATNVDVHTLSNPLDPLSTFNLTLPLHLCRWPFMDEPFGVIAHFTFYIWQQWQSPETKQLLLHTLQCYFLFNFPQTKCKSCLQTSVDSNIS